LWGRGEKGRGRRNKAGKEIKEKEKRGGRRM